MSRWLIAVPTAFAACGLAFCLGAVPVAPAYADLTSAEKQAEAESVLARLNAMQATLDNLSVDYGEALAAQEAAEKKRDAAEARLVEINGKIEDLQGDLSGHAREMYRSGGVSYLDTLLKANTFEEFVTSWDILNRVNERAADMVQTSKELAVEEQQQAAIFDEQAVVASEKAGEAARAAEQAQATISEMQATYDKLSEEAVQLLEEERKAKEAEEAARVEAVMAEAAAAAERNAAERKALAEQLGANADAQPGAESPNALGSDQNAVGSTGVYDEAAEPSAGAAGSTASAASASPDNATGSDTGNGDGSSAGDAGSGAVVEGDAVTASPDVADGAPEAAAEPAASTDPADAQAPAEEATSAVEQPNASEEATDGGQSEEVVQDDSSDDSSGGYVGGSDTVSRAYECLGAPYVWGGVGPDGYDCSGLVSYCLSGSHIRLGTTYTFMGWPMVSNPQPGDIAVNSGHTGIYIGDGQMIHASTYGVGVIIGPVQSGMIFVRYAG